MWLKLKLHFVDLTYIISFFLWLTFTMFVFSQDVLCKLSRWAVLACSAFVISCFPPTSSFRFEPPMTREHPTRPLLATVNVLILFSFDRHFTSTTQTPEQLSKFHYKRLAVYMSFNNCWRFFKNTDKKVCSWEHVRVQYGCTFTIHVHMYAYYR